MLPARLTADIVRALEPGAVTVEPTATRCASPPAGRSSRSGPCRPTTSRACAESGADAVTLPADDVRRGACARWCGRPAPTTPGRSSPACCWPPRSEGCGWSPPTRTGWPCATCPARPCCGEGQKVLVPSRALNELARAAPSSEHESRCASASARPPSRSASARLTTRLIEGEFPNYRQLIPQHYPNRLTVGREALLDAVRRVKLLARESTHPVRLRCRPTGSSCTAIDAGDRAGRAESLDAKYEGTEMTVAFNPDYLPEGVEAVAGDEVVLETLDALKPAVVRAAEQRRLPVPAHARAGAVDGARCPCSLHQLVGSTRLPQLRDGRTRASTPGLARCVRRAPTARARRTSSRRSATWPRWRASGRAARGPRARRRRRRGACGPRSCTPTAASCWSRPSSPRRPPPGTGQPPAAGRSARPARRRCG